MTESRKKRLPSSMTYEEYLNTFDKPPAAPIIGPKKREPEIQMDDLNLLDDTQIIKPIYKPKHIIKEEDEECKTPLFQKDQNQDQFDNIQQKKRQRAQSENIQFTFISFVERNIERKQSKKLE